MRKILFSTILALCATSAFAMFEDWQVGIRPNAMAGCYTAVANDVEGVRWNPSGLAELKGWQTVAYAKQLWSVPGLMNQTLTVGRELGRWGGAAVSVQQVGCDVESDQNVMLSHGFNLTDQLAFGYTINGYRLWQQRFGSAITAGIDVGLMARVYRKWRIGASGHNLNHPSLGKLREYDLPSGVAVGVAYEAFPGTLGSLELSKDAGYVTKYKVGCEYSLVADKLKLRGGVSNEGALTLYSMGLGVKVR
ncbi:MAG TPA: hypothetical protein VMF29_02475, partial [Candidatus Edwardsbacteria bacterium]|nr:hypothetical protein [Candidatus Edwardsbacteria bacterium]